MPTAVPEDPYDYGSLKFMEPVEEIESAITALSLEEFRRIANWVRERDHLASDQQLDSDGSGGALDFLFGE